MRKPPTYADSLNVLHGALSPLPSLAGTSQSPCQSLRKMHSDRAWILKPPPDQESQVPFAGPPRCPPAHPHFLLSDPAPPPRDLARLKYSKAWLGSSGQMRSPHPPLWPPACPR